MFTLPWSLFSGHWAIGLCGVDCVVIHFVHPLYLSSPAFILSRLMAMVTSLGDQFLQVLTLNAGFYLDPSPVHGEGLCFGDRAIARKNNRGAIAFAA